MSRREGNGSTAVGERTEGEEPLVRVQGLRKHFQLRSGWFRRKAETLRAVDGVSFHLDRGETLGLVGESGCGKSTTARAVLRLVEPTAGEIHFDGRDVMAMEPGELRRFRGRAQIVFQDPLSSLNPRMRVGTALAEVLKVHGVASDAAERRQRVRNLLETVELAPELAERHPHELSGGQRQRVGIARALAVDPELLILDEPVSALDVPVRRQILGLVRGLQREFGLTCLFIAHDLSVVEAVSDRVAVMYLGRIVEVAPVSVLFSRPAHPYTRALLAATPRPEPGGWAGPRRPVLEGDVPSSVSPPSGCPFHPRCPHPERDEECRRVVPHLETKGKAWRVACMKAPTSPDARS